jgi:acyl carrier protein
MERSELLAKLNELFVNVFDDDEITLTEDVTADDIDDWDSVMHINLILEIEGEFDVKFTSSEVVVLRNVGDLISLIRAKRS